MFRTASIVRFAAALVGLLALAGPAPALFGVFRFCPRDEIERTNRTLAGQLLDFTNNHGCDRRVFSPTLGEKRDVYVYLPPGFDGKKQFPGMLWLHGLNHDEKHFLDVAPLLDEAIRCGKLPPMVIACPDASIRHRPELTHAGSFYMNGINGNYADYVSQDIWNFLKKNYCVRPERGAHVLGGASMGGYGSVALGFKNRDEFGVLVALMPPLNLRYGNCRGKYMTNYDPNCFALRETDRRHEVIGRFFGVVVIRARRLLDPVVGRNHPDPTGFLAKDNPYEMLTALGIKPNEFELFIGYGKKDEFNLDAQVESFLDEACRLGIKPHVLMVPDGRHNKRSAFAMFPEMCRWMTEKLAPFAEPVVLTPKCGKRSCRPLGSVRSPALVTAPAMLFNELGGSLPP